MMICIICKEKKDLNNFYRNKQNKCGYEGCCKVCSKLRIKKYCQNNKEKIKKRSDVYYENNKHELIKKTSDYYKKNKEKVVKRVMLFNKNKKQTNPLFKLRCNISSLINTTFKRNGYTKNSQSYKILGCSFTDFKNHLERQFTTGMNWENQGQWHMDHIYPVSLAKDEEELIKLNHYTNFQPLWAFDNLSKGNKIIEKQLTLI